MSFPYIFRAHYASNPEDVKKFQRNSIPSEDEIRERINRLSQICTNKNTQHFIAAGKQALRREIERREKSAVRELYNLFYGRRFGALSTHAGQMAGFKTGTVKELAQHAVATWRVEGTVELVHRRAVATTRRPPFRRPPPILTPAALVMLPFSCLFLF